MSHDHAEIELAAAAIDFELTPSERARLDKALAECPVCARAAAGYRRQAILLQALPVVDASPAVRRQVERAVGVRPQRSSGSWVWLAAAMLGLLVTGAVVAGAIDRARQDERLSQVPTASPVVTTAPSAPPAVASPDVVELDPPSGELADVGPPLAHDSMAIVVTDNLRIRSAPFVGQASIKYRRLLQNDDRMVVIDGPVVGQNYEWYQVMVWRPTNPSLSWPVGWVARAGHDGEVWFQATSVQCPASPMSIEALLAMAPADRLACYHDRSIDVRAVVGTAVTDCDSLRAGCATGPAWLATSALRASTSAAVDDPVQTLPIALAPDAGLTADEIERAGVVRLQGAFDHPSATACGPDRKRIGPDGPLAPIDAVLQCRMRFVVTRMTAERFPPLDRVSARTVSDRVRIRSLPAISDASIKYEPLLRLGARLTILDGPVLGNGYAWYHVTVPASTRSGSTPITGWVAAAGLDGERWLKADAP